MVNLHLKNIVCKMLVSTGEKKKQLIRFGWERGDENRQTWKTKT